MNPPVRERINPFLHGEENWLKENNYPINFEYDIPALDRLKDDIKKRIHDKK